METLPGAIESGGLAGDTTIIAIGEGNGVKDGRKLGDHPLIPAHGQTANRIVARLSAARPTNEFVPHRGCGG